MQIKHSSNSLNHLQEIKNILQSDINSIYTITQLSEQYQNLYEKEINKIEIQIDISTYKQIRKIENKLNILLQEVIIGDEDVDIAKLINTLGIKMWIEQGI